MYKRNIEVRSLNNCCRGKGITTTYSECVSVAIAAQHAKSMRPIIFSFVVFWIYHICSHYLIKGTILVKKLSNINFVF
jgi:hypothetical protein